MATMNPAAVTFEHILVPTDFSEVSQRAIEYAKAIAKQSNAELLLIHVSPPVDLATPPEAAWIDLTEIQSIREKKLEQSSAALRSDGYRAQAISLVGSLHDELLHAVKQHQVDLIVLGTHGRTGLDRLLFGSDAEAVLRHAPCPVLCIGPAVPALQGKMWQLRELICATSLKPSSAEVAALADKLAAEHGAELVLLHMKDGDEQDADWASFEEAFRHYSPEHPERGDWLRTRLASVAPGVGIVELAKQHGADLIVMGARPASSIATHLAPGTVATVLMEAPCPVLTLLQR